MLRAASGVTLRAACVCGRMRGVGASVLVGLRRPRSRWDAGWAHQRGVCQQCGTARPAACDWVTMTRALPLQRGGGGVAGASSAGGRPHCAGCRPSAGGRPQRVRCRPGGRPQRARCRPCGTAKTIACLHPNRKLGPTMDFGREACDHVTLFCVDRKPDGSFCLFAKVLLYCIGHIATRGGPHDARRA